MCNHKPKCIIILSTYSSGSSPLLDYLAKFPEVNHIVKTRHGRHETLFWTKAASILGLPQIDILDSKVPINGEGARKDLVTLLRENLDHYEVPADNTELIFGGVEVIVPEIYASIYRKVTTSFVSMV